MSKTYKARTTAPSKTDKNYLHINKGGYNYCILVSGKSVLPNCVGYAWGRWRELLGKYHRLSRNNAEVWFTNKNDGYKRGKTPKLGAVICWSKGKVGVGSDGAGHVAIVEKIYSDGSILTSNSAWNGARFYTKKIAKGYKLNGYKFQGFIYPPVEFTSTTTYTYTTGGYITLQNMNIRTGAGTTYSKKKVKELTKDGQKNATSKNPNDYAVYKKGTDFTCLKVLKNKDGSIWSKTPSGFVCLKSSEGKQYCKKVS